tara:strand:- start:4002 stop:5306 length:1305 start_codon:yes stop_codon:yes gene_type:complete
MSKLSKFSFLGIFLVIFNSCSKGETPIIEPSTVENPQPQPEVPNEPAEEIYFTYSAPAGDGDNWIVIHDTNGVLVDYKKVENGGPIKFMALNEAIPEKMSVTELFYSKDAGNNQYHTLVTYTDIAPGSVWDRLIKAPQSTAVGTFSVHIENIPGIQSNTISTTNGAINAAASNTVGNNANAILNLLDIPLYESDEYIISIYDFAGGHKYLKLSPPMDTDDITVDYSDLLLYNSILEVNLPAYDFALLFTYGYLEADPNFYWSGQAFSNHLDFNSSGLFMAGYLDNYSKYRTDFSITQGDFTYGFTTAGDRLQDITIPAKPSFTLENATIYDMKYTSELTPITKNTRHSYNTFDAQGAAIRTQWEVLSSGSEPHKVGHLPEEIVALYPDINLENITLDVVNLVTKGIPQQSLFNEATLQERKGNFTIESFGFSNF